MPTQLRENWEVKSFSWGRQNERSLLFFFFLQSGLLLWQPGHFLPFSPPAALIQEVREEFQLSLHIAFPITVVTMQAVPKVKLNRNAINQHTIQSQTSRQFCQRSILCASWLLGKEKSLEHVFSILCDNDKEPEPRKCSPQKQALCNSSFHFGERQSENERLSLENIMFARRLCRRECKLLHHITCFHS